ncbi:MAG: hypothetical protein K9L61_01460 [Candidatus Omnitrophica bacterium]|nr:hypothetical protein [Candidatus Omnitrophota bacterium]
MILIVVAIIILISILLLAFVSFSPHFTALTESDFMRRGYENATLAGLKWGELKERAGTFPVQGITTYIPLRKNEDAQGNVSSNHFLRLDITEQAGEIQVNVTHTNQSPEVGNLF